MDAESEARQVTAALGARHPGVDTFLIDRLVRRRFAAYAGARIAVFVPVLVQREVRHQLESESTSRTAP